jgi:hypothetical protein
MTGLRVTIVMRFVALLSLLAAVAAASPAPPWLAAQGYWKEDKYELWLSIEETGGRLDWDADKEDPPLGVKAAIGIARNALQRIVGEDSQSMICHEIELQPRGTHSYYIVTFVTAPTTADFDGKSSFSITVMPFAVLMDGTLRLPKKKPIQPAQPTRGKAPRG